MNAAKQMLMLTNENSAVGRRRMNAAKVTRVAPALRRSDLPLSGTRVEIEQLTKRYASRKDSIAAVTDVTLEVPPGTVTILLGPSGSGKSTILRCVAGLERPEAGSILFDGETMNGPGVYVRPSRRNIGMVFQSYALWPHMKVGDNVGYPLARRRGRRTGARQSRSEIREAVRGTLELVGLGGMEDRWPRELSGGQQQRVALARALVSRSGLMLLDEPLSNLDAKLRMDMRYELRSLVQKLGFSALYVTHDQDEALAIGDQIVVVNNGRIEQSGAANDIFSTPASSFVAKFVGSNMSFQGVAKPASRSGHPEVRTRRGSLCGRYMGPGGMPRNDEQVEVVIRTRRLLVGEEALRYSNGKAGVLNCPLSSKAFRGHHWELVLESPHGERVSVPAERDPGYDVGSDVPVTAQPADVMIFPLSADASLEPDDRSSTSGALGGSHVG